MSGVFEGIMDFINYTKIPDQINDVDIVGLLSNGWFMLPFLCLLIYQLIKKAVKNIMLIGIVFGLWVFSGTPYVREIKVDGVTQMDKVLPLAVVSFITIGLLIYLFFIRSDD